MARKDVDITFRPNALLRRIVERGPQTIFKGLAEAYVDIGRTFEAEFVQRRLRRHSSSSLGPRTGMLKRSFHFVVLGQRLSELTLHFGFGPPAGAWAGGAEKYAHVHETGMTIKPKNGKFLAIPIGKNKTKAKVGGSKFATPRSMTGKAVFVKKARFGPTRTRAGEVKANLPVNRPVFVPRKTKPGWVILWNGEPMFVLVPSVDIPPRLNFQNDWNKFRPRAIKRLEKEFNSTIAELNRGDTK